MNPPSPYPQSPPPARLGLAIASLVLGILALLASLFLVGFLFGLVGLGLGVAHIVAKRGRNAMAWWGMILSVVGILASVGLGVVYYKAFYVFKETFTSMADSAGPSASEWEGVQAPDISVTTLDGKAMRLSELKGKRVVLDFWATWCGPCVKEIPHFIKLQNETSREELVILGISQEDEATLKPFVKKKGLTYNIASAGNLPAPYKDVQSIPTTFFIDRKGVIQSVAAGYHDFEQLKAHALGKDFEGEAKSTPAPAASGLKDSARMLNAVAGWSTNLPGGQAICAGDWDGDGKREILVADIGRKLHVIGLDGVEKACISLPDSFTAIECGRHKEKGARLLGYSTWGNKLSVMDGTGKVIWTHSAALGLDGAHWGDLDGDGTDEMVLGMNGFGGLQALSAEGKRLWRATLGNVWNQAIIPAATNRSALVLATEAGGSVRVFDAKGRPLATLRPNGKYCDKLAAAVMDHENTIQVIAHGNGEAIAFDPNGRVAWSTLLANNPPASGNPVFACGDIDGDGILEWVFLDPAGDLVVATLGGEKLASVSGQSGVSGFVIVPDTNGRGLLITLKSGTLQAYSFQ